MFDIMILKGEQNMKFFTQTAFALAVRECKLICVS